MNDVRCALYGLTVFQSLLPADLDALAASFVERRYSRGETVGLRVGDDPVLLGVLVRGDAEWQSGTLDLANLWEGASFGDLSTDYRFDSTVAVTVRRDATIALFTRGAFMTFAARHPQAVVLLVRSFASTLSRTQRRAPMLRVPRPGRVRALVGRLVHWIESTS